MDKLFSYNEDLYEKTIVASGRLSLLSRRGKGNEAVNSFIEKEAVSLLLATVDLLTVSDNVKCLMCKDRVKTACLRSLAILALMFRTGEMGKALYASLTNDLDTVMKGLEPLG